MLIVRSVKQGAVLLLDFSLMKLLMSGKTWNLITASVYFGTSKINNISRKS